MIALPELQAALGRSITSDVPAALLSLIAGDAAEAAARLSIYRNNVLLRLTKSLRETYPVVCRLVDERFFDYAADAYIRTALPTEGCLSDYGDTFPAFLAAFRAASSLPYLPDLASLEWCVHCALRAAPLPTLRIESLAAQNCDPAMLRLRIAPWLGYLASRYNVDRIWAAHQPEGLPGSLQVESTNVSLEVNGLGGLTFRQLTPATWVFRSSLARGDSLGDATKVTLNTFPHFDLTAALSALFHQGCVVSIGSSS
jgi:hypothetical protein